MSSASDPSARGRRSVIAGLVMAGLLLPVACTSPGPGPEASPPPSRPATPAPTRTVHRGHVPYVAGEPIDRATLTGRILFDDFEDLSAMNIDGSDLVHVANQPGSEFDGAWSPDGQWIVYRDSTRGINVDDEIFIARADGTERRNLTNHPANDWGPDWSPDGSTIVFNSDRDGGALRGYLVNPDGSNLRPITTDGWFEYPSFSHDGRRIVFEGADSGSYELFVLDLASGAVRQVTNSPGNDAWAVWSPDGAAIAFTSQRDDCRIAPRDAECWSDESAEDPWHDIWVMAPDGSNVRRVSPEAGQFVAWSPDSRHLLISGRALYVVRPDGTGRVEIRTPSIPLPLGGIPDWRAP